MTNETTHGIPKDILLQFIAAIDRELGGERRREYTMRRIKRSSTGAKTITHNKTERTLAVHPRARKARNQPL